MLIQLVALNLLIMLFMEHGQYFRFRLFVYRKGSQGAPRSRSTV